MEKKHKKWFLGLAVILVIGISAVLAVIFWPEKEAALPVQGKIAMINGVEISRESISTPSKGIGIWTTRSKAK